MMPDTGRLRLQHDLRDLGSLQRPGLVSSVDFEVAERDDRGGVEGSGDEMGFLATKSAFKRERGLGEVAHLQHLPAANCLKDAQRPVLPVTLGCHYPCVDSLKRILVPVVRGEDPSSEDVRETSPRVALAIELTAFCSQKNLERAPEVEQLVGHSGLREFKRELAHLTRARVGGLAGTRLDFERLLPSSGHGKAVIERCPEFGA